MNISKVLLVDDDPYIRRVAQISLASVGGWQVRLASSGQEALEMLTQEKPDLVLLDVMMPIMDGPTTLTRLKEMYPDLPVIFMTAKVQRHEVDRYLSMNAAGVIGKPFDPIELPVEIMNILTGRPEGLYQIA